MFRDDEAALRLRIESLEHTIAEERARERAAAARCTERRAEILDLRRRLDDASPLGPAKRIGARLVFAIALGILVFALGSAAAAHLVWSPP